LSEYWLPNFLRLYRQIPQLKLHIYSTTFSDTPRHHSWLHITWSIPVPNYPNHIRRVSGSFLRFEPTRFPWPNPELHVAFVECGAMAGEENGAETWGQHLR
jgi:hypothetical protein